MSALYAVEGLSFRYDQAPVLRDVTLTVGRGEMVAVVGPNGAGKSTLLSILAGVLDRFEGSCRFDGREMGSWNKRALARRAAFIPQMLRLEFPFTAEQVAFMGRTPHCHGLFETEDDRRAVHRALELTDVLDLAPRPFRELSGGERQRVVLAAALAQEPEALLLDEPTTFLDIKHQISIYSLLAKLASEGMTVIAITHDLNLASAYASRIIALREGRLAADGPPIETVNERFLRDVFDAKAFIRHGEGGRPWVSYC